MPSVDDDFLRTNLCLKLGLGNDKRRKKVKIGDVELSDTETVAHVMKALSATSQPMPLR